MPHFIDKKFLHNAIACPSMRQEIILLSWRLYSYHNTLWTYYAPEKSPKRAQSGWIGNYSEDILWYDIIGIKVPIDCLFIGQGEKLKRPCYINCRTHPSIPLGANILNPSKYENPLQLPYTNILGSLGSDKSVTVRKIIILLIKN